MAVDYDNTPPPRTTRRAAPYVGPCARSPSASSSSGKRTRPSAAQLAALQRAFAADPTPSLDAREALAAELGMCVSSCFLLAEAEADAA